MIRAAILAVALTLATVASPVSAHDDYDSRHAGHPLRLLAYLLHPVGVLLDRTLARPAWELGQKEPLRTWIGMSGPEHGRSSGSGTNPFLEPYSEDR